jgi:antitoxin component YwqK of YwqJK toxin-antitoxin module
MKNKFFIFAFTAITFCAAKTSAQDNKQTFHLNAMMQMSTELEAAFKLVLTKTGENMYEGEITDYMGQLKASGSYMKIGKSYLEDGQFVYFYPSGKVESKGEFVKGIKVGTWERYDNSGKRKADRYYPAESADMVRESMQLEKEEEKK